MSKLKETGKVLFLEEKGDGWVLRWKDGSLIQTCSNEKQARHVASVIIGSLPAGACKEIRLQLKDGSNSCFAKEL